MSRLGLGVAASVAALAILVPAAASSGEDAGRGPDLPPSFVESLKRVPASSCLHDPRPCGATRVVEADAIRDASGGVAFAPITADSAPAHSARSATARSRAARRAASGTQSARAAQVIYACYLQSNAPEIINVNGNYKARATGRNKCSPPVAYMETYVNLLDYIQTGWRNLSANRDSRRNGDVTLTTPSWDCYHVSVRAYQTLTEGYALIQPTLYYANDREYNNHTCPS